MINAGADSRFYFGLDLLLADEINELGTIYPSIKEVLAHEKDANMKIKYCLLYLRFSTWVKACH